MLQTFLFSGNLGGWLERERERERQRGRTLSQFKSEHTSHAHLRGWDLFIGDHGDLIDFLTAAATNSLRALSHFESEHTNPAHVCQWAGISSLVAMVGLANRTNGSY